MGCECLYGVASWDYYLHATHVLSSFLIFQVSTTDVEKALIIVLIFQSCQNCMEENALIIDCYMGMDEIVQSRPFQRLQNSKQQKNEIHILFTNILSLKNCFVTRCLKQNCYYEARPSGLMLT